MLTGHRRFTELVRSPGINDMTHGGLSRLGLQPRGIMDEVTTTQQGWCGLVESLPDTGRLSRQENIVSTHLELQKVLNSTATR